MSREFVPTRLDVIAFAEAGAVVSADESIERFERLSAEMSDTARESTIHWQAVGASRETSEGAPAPWLHLTADARATLVCQRCLESVDIGLQVDRWFRFAADEATAALEDEASEEDVLVASRNFDLLGLVEDELLMELPAVPKHDVCPRPVRLSIEDPGFKESEVARPNPFAALDHLRARKVD